jgi:predicted PurR-regulated permease PerM
MQPNTPSAASAAPADAAVPLVIAANGTGLKTDLRNLERIALGILTLVVLGVCYVAKALLAPIMLALLLSLLLSPLVNALQDYLKLPRVLGSLIVIALVVAAMAWGVTRLSEPARKWIDATPATVASLQQRFLSLEEPMRKAREASETIDELTRPSKPHTVVAIESGFLDDVAVNVPRVLGTIGAVLLLVYFFLSSGNGFLRRMVEVAPLLTDKKRVVAIARDVQEEVSRYLMMVSLINGLLALAVSASLYLMGVPNPLLWGVVTFLFNFIPYVGPVIMLALLALVGFSAFESITAALAVPGVFLLLNTIEGQFVTPTVLGRRLSLDPTVVFVWLMLWGWLWGVTGFLLAGPLLACFGILCRHNAALRPVGILISNGRKVEADAAN